MPNPPGAATFQTPAEAYDRFVGRYGPPLAQVAGEWLPDRARGQRGEPVRDSVRHRVRGAPEVLQLVAHGASIGSLVRRVRSARRFGTLELRH